tara:strand:- start:22055 stop:23164 length:1110 start_codon:yes stop_codon:yes gene_type:complete
MNIAFVVFDYFPYGGLQRDMLAIAKVCRERLHRVTILARSWQGDIPDGETVELLPIGAGSNHSRDAAFAKVAAEKFCQYDLIVGFNKISGLDVYYAADGCLAERYQGLKTILPRYRSKLAMERAVFQHQSNTRVLSIAPPQKALYQQHYATAEQRFIDLPPGIRRDRALPENFAARRAALRAQCCIDEQTTMLLFVGSGFRTKGLDRAIRLLAGLDKTVQLFIVGEDKRGQFERLAKKQGVSARVHFIGGRDDVQDWLWSADLLVHLAYAENTGTVLLEAAIAGLPVLTTSVCGYAPYISEADMGAVVTIGETPPADAVFVQHAKALLAKPRADWRERSVSFARDADIYSLTEHAVDGIEETARQKGVL